MLSIGPVGGNGAFTVNYSGRSSTGSRVFFNTSEPLVTDDTDASIDIYQRLAATRKRISVGVINGNGAFDSAFGAPRRRPRVLFNTDEPLVGGDTDAATDIYQRSGDTTKRISVGEINGNGDFRSQFAGRLRRRLAWSSSEPASSWSPPTPTRGRTSTSAPATTTSLVSAGQMNGNRDFNVVLRRGLGRRLAGLLRDHGEARRRRHGQRVRRLRALGRHDDAGLQRADQRQPAPSAPTSCVPPPTARWSSSGPRSRSSPPTPTRRSTSTGAPAGRRAGSRPARSTETGPRAPSSPASPPTGRGSSSRPARSWSPPIPMAPRTSTSAPTGRRDWSPPVRSTETGRTPQSSRAPRSTGCGCCSRPPSSCCRGHGRQYRHLRARGESHQADHAGRLVRGLLRRLRRRFGDLLQHQWRGDRTTSTSPPTCTAFTSRRRRDFAQPGESFGARAATHSAYSGRPSHTPTGYATV